MYCVQVNVYHVNTEGIDECMLNVQHYSYFAATVINPNQYHSSLQIPSKHLCYLCVPEMCAQ